MERSYFFVVVSITHRLMSSRSELTVVRFSISIVLRAEKQVGTKMDESKPEGDEEKIVGSSSGGGLGGKIESDDTFTDSSEHVTDPWEVRFEPGESINPMVGDVSSLWKHADGQNWGVKYRWYLTFASGLLTLNSTFSSSIPSGIANSLQADFPLEGMPVAVLCISLVCPCDARGIV